MQNNIFGTDGIRDKVGSGFMKPEKVLKLGWAIGQACKNSNNEILIGKDTRVSGYMLESALESGLAAAGMNIGLLGPMPTPAIAYLTRTFRANAGIVISASHNPFYDNGIKLFGNDGYKISPNIEERISYFMQQDMITTEPENIGKARRIEGAPDRYIEFCKSKFFPELSLAGLKIVIDCANGSTYHIANKVFQELGAKVVSLAVSPNGYNINEKCGSTNIENIQQEVLQTGSDFGISYDGDGDRVLMCDNKANIIDGDSILYILASHMQKRGKLNNTGVVGTIMSNKGLEVALKAKNIELIRTNVGDKYIMQQLREKKWFLGGEPSGHILNLKKSTSGDGIISSILVINALLEGKNTFAELLNDLELYPQQLYAIKCDEPKKIMASSTMNNLINKADKIIGQHGRVLIRASGTEPKIRLMVESNDTKILNAVADELLHDINELVKEQTYV